MQSAISGHSTDGADRGQVDSLIQRIRNNTGCQRPQGDYQNPQEGFFTPQGGSDAGSHYGSQRDDDEVSCRSDDSSGTSEPRPKARPHPPWIKVAAKAVGALVASSYARGSEAVVIPSGMANDENIPSQFNTILLCVTACGFFFALGVLVGAAIYFHVTADSIVRVMERLKSLRRRSKIINALHVLVYGDTSCSLEPEPEGEMFDTVVY